MIDERKGENCDASLASHSWPAHLRAASHQRLPLTKTTLSGGYHAQIDPLLMLTLPSPRSALGALLGSSSRANAQQQTAPKTAPKDKATTPAGVLSESASVRATALKRFGERPVVGSARGARLGESIRSPLRRVAT